MNTYSISLNYDDSSVTGTISFAGVELSTMTLDTTTVSDSDEMGDLVNELVNELLYFAKDQVERFHKAA